MQELSRGKEAALDHERTRLESEKKREVVRELERQAEEWKKKLKDVEEEGRLGREELELRLKAASKSETRSKDIEAKLSKLNNDNKTLRSCLIF